jgi:small-conductance mechanosensitive channel
VFVDASYGDPPDRVLRELLAAADAVKEVRKTPAPLAMVLE